MKKRPDPYLFDEFFASGKEESISPFLFPSSRKWAHNLTLKNAIFTAIIFSIAFATSFFSLHLSNLFLAMVYFLVGTPAVLDTVEDLRNFEINIDVLMTLAALLSILIGSQMEGALLLVLFALSGSMEKAVSSKTKSAIQNLRDISPSRVTLLENNIPIEKNIHEIQVKNSIVVKAGEIIPLDGKITQGSSYVNLLHLTGESLPTSKTIGDEVYAGSHNLDGMITVEVSKTSHESTLAQIIQLIQGAQAAKPKVEKLLDRFGKYYASTIILLSAAFAGLLPFLLSIPFLSIEGSVYRALAFLIAASPCALIIATPTAYLSAISACARKGILLKGGVILDAICSAKIIAFDKTGTLTQGKLTFSHIDSYSSTSHTPLSQEEIFSIAATLEQGVLHPIAETITLYASQNSLSLLPLEQFKSKPGYGVEGMVTIQDKKVLVLLGSFEHILVQLGEKTIMERWPYLTEEIKNKEHLLSCLLVESNLYLFHFMDHLRPKIQNVISDLKRKFSFRILMLTGDHQKSAERIAKEAGIEEYYFDLKPEDKLHLIARFIQEGSVTMIGDGINDAPSLMRSNVGISMGKIGSSSAIEASDAIFLHDDLSQIPWLFKKAKQTRRILLQNISLAFLVILLATTPSLLGFIPLWLAVILHEGGTVIVGLNSLRLLK